MLGAPQPRFRIYTSPNSYRMVLPELFRQAEAPEALESLERAVTKRTGARFAVTMPTARTGIYLTLRALIRPGQKVILSPLTIVDVVNMVIAAGGIPVFADVGRNTCNIDAEEVEKLLSPEVGAVLVTHLHGLACDIRRIRAACDQAEVPLIEDAAQSYSATVEGKWTGTFGRAGIFSFGLYKIVNAFFGGMVITDDETLYRRLKAEMGKLPLMAPGMLRHKVLFGLATDLSTLPLPFSAFTYWFFRYGFLNEVDAILDLVTVDRHPKRSERIRPELLCRLRPQQARLIERQLDTVAEGNAARIRAAQRYDAGLRSIPELTLPPLHTDGSHLYTYYAIRSPDRRGLMRHGFKRRRDWVLSHYHNCASLEIFKDFYRPCPNAEATAQELLYLPTYPRYRVPEIDRNVAVVRDFFRRA
jgi:perosamine synthetase